MGSEYIDSRFLDLSISWEWSATRPGRFTPWEESRDVRRIGSWVDLRAGLDDLVKRKFFTLLGLELRILCRSARSQLL
jgi:hypothetical protein